nr:hypothetical protein [Tanacetum cinerariifolium]
MATTIDQQMPLDEALVPSTKRLRIGRSNFRLPFDIQSKESTLQVVYDVLRRCPFFQAFLMTADVLEIYMQEFWATAIVHHHSIRFKMNNKKHIINLETFRDMLLVYVNVNKLFQPWRSFRAVINKCLTGKSSGFDSFRLSQAQLLWGLYHRRNIDYAFLIWEDFMDDNIFLTIKVVSRHQDTQQYGAILPIELTNEDIRNTTAYKEYYAYATGVAAPKLKASARKKMGDSDTSLTPPIATPTPITTAAPVPRLSAAVKGKQPARATTPTEPTDVERTEDEGTGSKPGVPDIPSDESEEEISWNSFDDEDVDAQDEGDKNDESDDGSDDGNDKTVKDVSERDDDDDDNDDEEELAKNDDKDTESGKGGDEVNESERESDEEETRQEEEESFDPIPRTPKGNELYRNVNINQGRGLQVTQNIEDSHVTLTPVHPNGLQESSSVSSFVTSMLNPISDAWVESIFTTASSPIVSLQTPTPIMTPSTIATITISSDAPIPPTTIPSIILENLPTFNSMFRFDERLRSLETTFSEYRQTNLFVDAVSVIPGIVHQYMTQQITEAVREVVQIQTDRLQDSFQRENDEFLCNIDENMKK